MTSGVLQWYKQVHKLVIIYLKVLNFDPLTYIVQILNVLIHALEASRIYMKSPNYWPTLQTAHIYRADIYCRWKRLLLEYLIRYTTRLIKHELRKILDLYQLVLILDYYV